MVVAKPRIEIGTFGAIELTTLANGKVRARARFRDEDGRLRRIEARDDTAAKAERRLKHKFVERVELAIDGDELTPDSLFSHLVEVWLEDLDLENRLAKNTRQLYERNIRNLVLPTFEHLTLREITVRRVDRFIKTLASTKSYSYAKQARTVMGLALGLAVRYGALRSNPVRDIAPLHKPQSKTMALTFDQVEAIRRAAREWRRGTGWSGPKPDGQLELIIEVMLGTSARIGEVLAIRKCDVDVTSRPATVRICGTIVSPLGEATYRQAKTKTVQSTRVVHVPSFAAEALRQRLVVIADEEPEHLLFFSRNGTPLTTNNVRRRLRTVLDDAGLPGVSPHAFRRTVATTLDRGSGAELAAEMLGHTSSKITKAHYIEPDEMVDPVTAEILEALAPRPDQWDDA